MRPSSVEDLSIGTILPDFHNSKVPPPYPGVGIGARCPGHVPRPAAPNAPFFTTGRGGAPIVGCPVVPRFTILGKIDVLEMDLSLIFEKLSQNLKIFFLENNDFYSRGRFRTL